MSVPSGDGLGPSQTLRHGCALVARASSFGYPSMGTFLKKVNTASGSCVNGELIGSIERDERIGEFCSMATDISNRRPA